MREKHCDICSASGFKTIADYESLDTKDGFGDTLFNYPRPVYLCWECFLMSDEPENYELIKN